MEETIRGKFKAYAHFAFVIPDNRAEIGWDFYINKDNYKDAVDGDRVEIRVLAKQKWKKPEAKVLRVLNGTVHNGQKFIEGVYSGGDGNFGFIDVEGRPKGVFVYGDKKNGARDGDFVKAEVIMFKGKEEAIVVKILETTDQAKLIQGTYRDNERFGFVVPDDNSGDIFIAGSRKNGAEHGDEVLVKIIKTRGKSPEGVIEKVL